MLLGIILLLFLPAFLFSQERQNTTITVRSTATVTSPADEIFFSIRLISEDKDSNQAYDAHKDLEQKLLHLLKKFDIPDSNITYSLMNIRKQSDRKGKPLFRTGQSVNVKLRDISRYESFQITLLSNNMDNFNASFSSSKRHKARDKALEKAIELAKAEEESIAKKMGKQLGDILEIQTTVFRDSHVRAQELYGAELQVMRSALLAIPQSVQSSASVTMKFELTE